MSTETLNEHMKQITSGLVEKCENSINYIKNIEDTSINRNNDGSYKFKVTDNFGCHYICFDKVTLEPGTYYLRVKTKSTATCRLHQLRLYDTANNSLTSVSRLCPAYIVEDWVESWMKFEFTEAVEVNKVFLQWRRFDNLTSELWLSAKEVDLVKECDFNIPYIDNSIGGYFENILRKTESKNYLQDIPCDDYIKHPKARLYAGYIKELYGWIIADNSGRIASAPSSGHVSIYRATKDELYYLIKYKHNSSYPLYAEYRDAELTDCIRTVWSDDYDIEACIKFDDETRYVVINTLYVSTGGTGTILYRLTRARGAWDKDYYPYMEVIKSGYLPNVGQGVMEWQGVDYKSGLNLLDNIATGNETYITGSIYNRFSWNNVYDETKQVYSIEYNLKKILDGAIAHKSRADIGMFHSMCPGNYGNYKEYDDKVIFYQFPTFVYDALYEAEKYPLRFIRYYNSTKNGKPSYNAIIDWRNPTAVQYYREALQMAAVVLNTEITEGSGIYYKDAVSSIQIRFFGKWGEGHNEEYINTYANDIETSEDLIKIVDIYRELFPDIRLIAPEDGKTDLYLKNGLGDFEKYLMTASNDVGVFGFFNDHIGTSFSNISNRDFDGLDIFNIFANRYKEAPVIGEDYNHAQYDGYLPAGVHFKNDCLTFHYCSFRYSNLLGSSKTVNYKHCSVKRMLSEVYDMLGARIFFIPICAYVSGTSIIVRLLLGNMGLTPVYGNYWNIQIVVRNSSGEEVDVIDNAFSFSEVPLMSETMQPRWYECLEKEITSEVATDVSYNGVHYYLRAVDTKGISANFYFSNIDRTAEGEYLIL